MYSTFGKHFGGRWQFSLNTKYNNIVPIITQVAENERCSLNAI